MKPASLARWLSALGMAVSLMAGAASAADVHVMISAGFHGAYSELGPMFERASGHHLVTTRGPSMGDSPESIPTRLARGEAADLVILDDGAADELGKRGLARADSKVRLARSLIGMVVQAGTAKPRYRQCRCIPEHAACGKIDRLFGQRQRYLSVDHAIPEARHRGSDRSQEPESARTSIR